MFEFSLTDGSSDVGGRATVAVVGSGAGLGRLLVELLADDPLCGTILGIDARPKPLGMPANYVHVQAGPSESYAEHFSTHEVGCAVHAEFNGALGADDPTQIVPSTERFLEACRVSTPEVVSYVSSAAVYGPLPDQDLLYEGALLQGKPGLPAQHIAAESLCFDYVAHDPNVCLQIVRPCQIVGRDMDTLLARMLQRAVIFVPREPAVALQLVHQDDAARALLRLLRSRCVGVFNLAADGVVTLPQLAKLCERRVVRVPRFLFRRFMRSVGADGLGDYFREPWLIASVKIKTEALFMFRYDGAEAFLDSLEEETEDLPTSVVLGASEPSDAESQATPT
ncbi:MAG: NAD-dependent epimerase/dehydratase family protein [Planctomycetes bacterium]|nr:NAD-dependent epimerase/dehydratase family protein [Planctomycetota bacterium]